MLARYFAIPRASRPGGPPLKGTIRSRREYQTLYETGRRAIGEHLVVFGLRADPNADLPSVDSGGPLRVGIVASRKVGDAVRRNRAKRVLRAALHTVRERVAPGSRMVLVARRSLVQEGMRTPDIARELEHLLARIGMLQEDSA